MTTVKPSLKALSLLLALLFLSLSLFSCQKQPEELPFELLNESELFAEDPLSLYRIVLPSTCTATLFDAAKELGEKLTEQTSVPSTVVYDTESVTTDENTVELLLGNCRRPVVRDLFSELRSNDYLCRASGASVVLGGRSEEATLLALERYYDELFVYATAHLLLPNSAGFLFRADYPISQITLNGFELLEYTVVYDEKSNVKALAEHLQDTLRSEGGYTLEICAAENFGGEKKQIYLRIDETEASDTFQILSNGHGITLSAADSFGLSVAIRHLNEQLLRPDSDGCVHFVTEARERIFYPHTMHEIATITFDAKLSEFSWLTAINQSCQTATPSGIFLGTIPEPQASALRQLLSDDYKQAEHSDLLTLCPNCHLQADLSELTSGCAKLYSIGSGDEAFLLLRLDHIPTVDLSQYLADRTLPLLFLIDTEIPSTLTQPPRISDDRFDVAIFEIDKEENPKRLFALYAEHGCFAPITYRAEGSFRSFTLHRSSVFYPTAD